MVDKNSFDGSLQTKGAFFKKTNLSLVQDQISDAVKKYIDSDRMTVLPQFAQERPCLVCGSSERETLFLKNCFPHVRCVDCGFVYVNPILNEAELVAYYSHVEGSWADVTENEAYTVYQNLYYGFHLDNIERVIQCPNRSILDVGCNNGEFLSMARQRGWTVMGQELNRYAVERARQKKIDVVDRQLRVEEFKGKKFGAISFLGVLEHVPNPGALVDVARELLEPGGVIAVLVPNIDSIATRVLHEKCNTFDGIEHINFWGRETFEKFLVRHGCTLAHAETAISELYTLNNFLNFRYPYSPGDESPLLLDFLTPEYIHRHFMGHHLCCYALTAQKGKHKA